MPLPVVVLGIDTPIGLTIIRDLGRHGVPVYGIARSRAAPGLSSRYLRQGLMRAADEEGIIAQLLELGARLGPACLYAISESDIMMLNRHRARLERCYRMLLPDAARMEIVLDKERTYEAAARVGVRVPRTAHPDSFDAVRAAADTLRFPVVLKWSDPNGVVRLLEGAGLALDKARYCQDADELLRYLAPYQAVGRYPLIQEYCPGYGLGQFVLMRDGVAHCTFQHRRVHEWPPEGGVSTLCETVGLEQHGELMLRSVALLRALRWEGIAMVEYRHDPLTGESALMEINGRFWGSLPLAYHAGVSFPWMLYRLQGLDQSVTQTAYVGGIQCRFMIAETKRLLRLLFQQKKVTDRQLRWNRGAELFGYLRDFLRPNMHYFVFEWRDPMPLLRDLWAVARRRG
ncbi:hypothetical protein [Rugamonas sp.]|uniref:carboxylate--amine ligase n=1 Tax=Rugamonas sp. TaxID=1926287 RepID=UPI0025EA99DF|nr:hypothetical protein [Rugamonas sp.]